MCEVWNGFKIYFNMQIWDKNENRILKTTLNSNSNSD